MGVRAPNAKQLVVVTHRIDRRGGQERSMLEILARLARRGWEIELYSFSLEDWPEHVPISWHPVPELLKHPQLLRNAWFKLASEVMVRLRRPPGIRLTIGSSSIYADLRVVQFVHSRFRLLIKSGQVLPPNPRSLLHRWYQRGFAWWNAFLERRLFPGTPHLLAISGQVAQDLLETVDVSLGSRITVAHHAADDKSGLTLEVGAVPEAAATVILFVGALERKGIAKALACLAATESRDWVFWVVGEGHLARWRSQAEALGIGSQVTFFGARPAAPFFAAADLLLFPSIYEPFGLVVAEAVAHGLVPVASSQCGAMELWPSRPDWLKLGADDPLSHWTAALDRLLASADVREEIAADAGAAFAQWSWDAAADVYEKTLVSLAAASGASRGGA